MKRSNRKFAVFKIFISIVIAAFVIANTWVLANFLNWISEFERAGSVTFDFSSYLAVQTFQNSLLQVYLFVFSLVLALAAVWGFIAIKQGAENRAAEVAEKRATEVAKLEAERVLKEYIEHLEKHKKLLSGIEESYSVKSMPPKEDVKEMKESNSRDVEKL